MALALYRKYRPKTLDELVGQETNVQLLQNAARQNKLAHAYLFYGSRGTGKTTTARLIAKLLNCEKRASDEKFAQKGEPCNECATCNEIDTNSSLDVVEIDAASNRGIDEIRNLKESIRTAPTKNLYKVYIIDEAHMLTGAAFNALLKTLEEPPPHGVLILATTEYEKLPATITSRTQRFLFKKLPKLTVLEKLTKIAKEEKISIDGAALELIASASEGSLRDAESLLDQISSLEKKIDLAAAERITGRVDSRKVGTLTEYILENKLDQSISYLSEIQSEGYNVVQLTKDLIQYLRRILALKTSAGVEPFLAHDLTKEEIAHLKELTKLADTEKVVRLIRALIRAYSEMRYSPFALVPLEVALVETLASKKS